MAHKKNQSEIEINRDLLYLLLGQVSSAEKEVGCCVSL